MLSISLFLTSALLLLGIVEPLDYSYYFFLKKN